MKLFNDKLSPLHRQWYRRGTAEARRVLKGAGWLLFKVPQHPDAGRDEGEQVDEALRLNELLSTAYYLREELRELGEQDAEEEATVPRLGLDGERRRGNGDSSGPGLELCRDAAGLLAWCDSPISAAPLEGTTNKITTSTVRAGRPRRHLQSDTRRRRAGVVAKGTPEGHSGTRGGPTAVRRTVAIGACPGRHAPPHRESTTG
jgi:hypothetical protein